MGDGSNKKCADPLGTFFGSLVIFAGSFMIPLCVRDCGEDGILGMGVASFYWISVWITVRLYKKGPL